MGRVRLERLDNSEEAAPILRRRFWWRATGGVAVFAFVAGVYALSVVDLRGYDPRFVPLTARSLLREGDLDLDEYSSDLLVGHPLTVVSDGGTETSVFEDPEELDRLRRGDVHVYDYFPWTTSLFATPAIAISDVVSGQDSEAPGEVSDYQIPLRLTASVLVALSAAMVWSAALLVFGGSPGDVRRRAAATVVALTYAFGTSAWSTASRAMWQHTTALLFVALGLWATLRVGGASGRAVASRWWAAAAGAALAGASVARPTNVVVVAAVGVWLGVRQRRALVPFVAAGLSVAAVFVVANLVLLDVAVPAYYAGSRLGMHDAFVEASAAQWVSPNRGLLWASPFLLLAIPGAVVWWRRGGDRVLVGCLTAAVAGITLSVSAYEHWWAGHSFGPRFMTEAVLPLLVLALPAVGFLLDGGWVRRRLAFGFCGMVVAWSVVFHGTGAMSRTVHCWNMEPVSIDEHPERVWSLVDGQMALAVRTARDSPRRLVFGPCGSPSTSLTSEMSLPTHRP